MKYYALRNSFDVQGDCVGLWMIQFPYWLIERLKTCNLGEQVRIWNPLSFAFAVRHGPNVDFPVAIGGLHVMSPRLQHLLTQIEPEAFQFLPFRIQTSTGEDVVEGYAVSHYLMWLDAIDKKRSQLFSGETNFKKYGGDYLLDRVVLDVKKIKNGKIFRVKGQSTLHVFREDIVDELRHQGMTGLHFVEIES